MPDANYNANDQLRSLCSRLMSLELLAFHTHQRYNRALSRQRGDDDEKPPWMDWLLVPVKRIGASLLKHMTKVCCQLRSTYVTVGQTAFWVQTNTKQI